MKYGLVLFYAFTLALVTSVRADEEPEALVFVTANVECSCIPDGNEDNKVDVNDLLGLLIVWGPCESMELPSPTEDPTTPPTGYNPGAAPYVFENVVAQGSNFWQMDPPLPCMDGLLLLDVSGDFVLNSGENFTWADDLTIMFANDDLSELYMQIGGFSDYGTSYRYTWPYGASGDPGTAAGGLIDIASVEISDWYGWIGNGYGSGGDGDWSGQIEFTTTFA